ncbi:hypothetical protein RHGRI_036941 [Rhododendron griersonianum]|uniref:Uncharacterized protein n=1 Tax=Rhododendron griersonianum TaxID=479676 RepID=A0AAV6HQG8_9ERIC|nr:hypothetical protein RHGRI_036941 [Rhododendron griersonianum]
MKQTLDEADAKEMSSKDVSNADIQFSAPGTSNPKLLYNARGLSYPEGDPNMGYPVEALRSRYAQAPKTKPPTNEASQPPQPRPASPVHAPHNSQPSKPLDHSR